VTHRAHLHQVLHEKVVELGVEVFLDSRVREYLGEEEEGVGMGVVLERGVVVGGDLVVAADSLFYF
jgi:flavin-dependent dehydrogenase